MKKENLNTTENKKTQEEEVMGYEYDDDIELDCVVMAGEGAVMRYDENGDVAAIYDEEKLNSAIEEEKVLNSRECKITNEDVAELILSVDDNEADVIKYFPYAKEMDSLGKLKLLIEAKHRKFYIDWPTGEFKPLVVERGEIIPDAWMAELYRIALIEHASYITEIKNETATYEKLLRFIDENSATKFYDYILDRADGWIEYADLKIYEFNISYRREDVEFVLSRFDESHVLDNIDGINSVIMTEMMDENFASYNMELDTLKDLMLSIHEDLIYYYDYYYADKENIDDERDQDDEEVFGYRMKYRYTLHGYGTHLFSGWFVYDLCSLVDCAVNYVIEIEDAIFDAKNIPYNKRTYSVFVI